MKRNSEWIFERVVAAAALSGALCSAPAQAHAMFADGFETGGLGAWIEESAASATPIEPAPPKYFPAGEDGVPNRFSVSLFSVPAASAAPELVSSVGGTLGYVYRHVLNGFQAELTDEQAELLSESALVKDVVQATYLREPLSNDLPYCYYGLEENTRSYPPLPDPGDSAQQDLDCADPAPDESGCIDNWGIDRIDQDVGRDESFSYRQSSVDVDVYVIDTGVLRTNREFRNAADSGSRVEVGYDVNTDCFPFCGTGGAPCDDAGGGHGTHVAGIIAGRTFGLAKEAHIVPIRAICSGYDDQEFMKALDVVADLHPPAAPTTAVVNISGLNNLDPCFYDTSCSANAQFRAAVVALAMQDNILIVQSAGNQSTNQTFVNACDHTFGDESRYPTNPNPALNQQRAIARIVIAGGSDELDGRWRWQDNEPGEPDTPPSSNNIASNAGACVDVFAPAAHIASAFRDPNDEDATDSVCQLSGTSMAAPHVSGVAAMILQDSPDLMPEQLKTLILNFAVRGALTSSSSDPAYIGSGSPNLLLHWEPSAIFRDGFETGDTRAWTEAVGLL